MNIILVIPVLVLILTVGLAPAYAQNDNDYLQKWKDYVESYKDYLESYKGYMEEYKKWAYDKFNDYEDEIKELKSMNGDEIKELKSMNGDEIKELKSMNENLSNAILDKDGEIIKVTDQSIRLGTIESGILNNIKIQKMQLVIDEQKEKIVYLTNKTNAYEIEQNYTEQLKTSSSHSKYDYQYEDQCDYNSYNYQKRIAEAQDSAIQKVQGEKRVLEFELNQCKENQ